MKELIRKILKEEIEQLPQEHGLIKTIKHAVGTEYQTTRFGPWEETNTDIFIRFHVTKVELQKYEKRPARTWADKFRRTDWDFQGLMYVKIDDLLIGSDERDEWERMYSIDDLSETEFDSFQEHLSTEIHKWLPSIDMQFYIGF